MKNTTLYLLLFLLLELACQHEKSTPSTAVSTEPPLALRTPVIAGTPSIQALQETITMNAVTVYTSKTNIRATTTGYVTQSDLVQGSQVKSGQVVYRLITKEAAALGEELLKDSTINITGIVPVLSKNSGIITQVFFQEGDFVVEGDLLAELTKPNSLSVKLYVPYEYNQHIRPQKQVKVRLPDGTLLDGLVGQVLPSEDIQSQTTPYLVSLSPFRYLPENLNLTVTVITKLNKTALVVPRQAVQSNEEQNHFWLLRIVNDTLAIRQPVTLGMHSDSMIELKNSGINTSDRIIVQGAYGLPDTAAITLVESL